MSSQRHHLRGISLLLLMLLPSGGIAGNSDFSAGAAFGRSNGGVTNAQMEKAGNNIGEYVPEFDKDKAESEYGGYYGGVKSSGRDMNAPGSAQFNSTEWGQSIQEHKRKAPDMPGVSAGDDFLKQGQKAIDNAQSMFDPNLCKSVSFDKVTTVNKTCERDLEVSRVCQRIAGVEWHGTVGSDFTTWEARLYHIPRVWEQMGRHKNTYTFRSRFSVPSPGNGWISGGRISASFSAWHQKTDAWLEIMGRRSGDFEAARNLNGKYLGVERTEVKAGQIIDVDLWGRGDWNRGEKLGLAVWRGDGNKEGDIRISFTFETQVNTLDAQVVWTDTCGGQ